jgi:glucan phosphoethanolaminetransferase (alkaline phosphatase superfamily)
LLVIASSPSFRDKISIGCWIFGITPPESKKVLGTNAAEVYDYLRIGFWLLAVDVLVVLGLLALAIFFGTKLSNAHAFILAAFWWSVMALIVASWICLAIVAGRSYKD